MTLASLFGAAPHISTGQACARAVLILLFGLLLVRVAGRRAFARWSALDIVVAIVVGSNLSRAMTGNAPLWPTLAATVVLMALHWLFAMAAARSTRASHLLEGEPEDIARDGRIDRGAARRHGVSDADIDEALRGRGLERAEETRRITVEPSGTITVLPRGAGGGQSPKV